ncbi:MAG: hypothetical protein HXS43_04185, partial [Theionarchaea archaeon]|nr:hypothetical protein [Theionarchaea archaeon]
MRSTWFGIFFISAGALLFEVSLTRIFSVSRWYHFAFMVVSIALLGFAASGSLLNLYPTLKRNRNAPFILSVLFSLSVVVSFYVSDKVEMDPYRIMLDPLRISYISIYYVVLSLPFLMAGLVISLYLSTHSQNAGQIYGFNLAGSAAGCLLIFAFSAAGSNIILVSSVLGAVGSLFFARNVQKLASLLVIIALIGLPGSLFEITMSPYKSLSLALNYPEARILDTEWNAVSRVDVVESPLRQAPGLSLKYGEGLEPALGTTIDGDSMSSLSEPGAFVEYLPTAAAYLKGPNTILIINPQGVDIAAAKYFSADITAAEGNPLPVRAIQRFSSLYDGVTVIHENGRTYLASTDELFDIIQISLSESIFASSVGLYGFNESYSFTVEAFEEYYAHLTEEGMVVITRWLVIPPRELPKVISLVIDTVPEPETHLAVFRSYSTVTVLVKKTPFAEYDVDGLAAFCRDRGFDMVWAPGITADEVNVYNRFPEPYFYQLTKEQLDNNAQVKKDYLFAVESPTDDSPFFFNFFQWRKVNQVVDSLQGKWQPLFEGGFMAVAILGQAGILSLALVFIPAKRVAFSRFTLRYFGLIGLGFMFVEISLMQQLILFLGQPVFSVAIVLSCILLFSGLGSVVSGRIGWNRGFVGLLGLLAVFAVGLSAGIHELLGV